MGKNIKKFLSFLVLSFLFIFACSEKDSSPAIDLLRVGIIPNQSIEASRLLYVPLFEHIKKETGIDYKLLFPSTYIELVQLFEEKNLDLALFGGYTYLRAHKQSSAVALVTRDTDTHFKSILFVGGNGDSDIRTIGDLKGRSFAFGPKLSTSGHLMPRYFLNKEGITPEDFFKEIQYTGAHDQTVISVKDGLVDGGVANKIVVQQMLNDGRINASSIHIIWESPPYTDYVWTAQNSLSASTLTKLSNAFLILSESKERDREILHALGAKYFLPAVEEDFNALEMTIKSMKREGF